MSVVAKSCVKIKYLSGISYSGLRICSAVIRRTCVSNNLCHDIVAQSTYSQRRLLHYVQRSCPRTTALLSSESGPRLCLNLLVGLPETSRSETIRAKHTKKQPKKGDSDDDDEDDDDDDKEKLKWDNVGGDKDSKIMKVKANSLRTDLLVKAGLGIARNKVETLFYDSKIRVNGQKIFKKSSQVHVGDEIDVIRGRSPMNPDFILVSRIEVLSASVRDDDTLSVHLRRFKTLTIENYPDPWKGTDSS